MHAETLKKAKIQLSRMSEFGCQDITELKNSPGIYCSNIMISDVERNYIAIVPDNYSGEEKFGLMFAFHGGGGNMKNFAFGHINPQGGGREEFHERAAEEKIILVYPQGTFYQERNQTSWNIFDHEDQSEGFSDDVGLIEGIISEFTEKLNIDLERVYAVGYSRGGDFAQFLGRRLSCIFAGVGSVGSSSATTPVFMEPELRFIPQGDNPVSVLMIKGDLDLKRPWEGGLNNNSNYTSSGIQDYEDWLSNNGCNEMSSIEKVLNPDSSYLFFNENCSDNVITQIIRGYHLAHIWPDHDDYSGINANRVFMDFFKELRNKSSCLTNVVDIEYLDFKVYPNPSFDKVYFDVDIPGSARIQIYSSEGKLIKDYDYNGKSELSTDGMAKGLYFLKINIPDKELSSRFIKM